MPGQTSVALGPAAFGGFFPFVPERLTCFLNLGVNHAGCGDLSVFAAVAGPAPTASASTMTPAASAVRFMESAYPARAIGHTAGQWQNELPHTAPGPPRSRPRR